MWGLLGLGSKFAAFIPGGQIFGILGAVGSAIAALVRAIFEGISVALANPVVFLIVALGFGGGFWEGLRWQQVKVDAARAAVIAANVRADRIVVDLKEFGTAKVKDAGDAAKAAPQPETPTEIAALCQRSASCRERSK